MNAAETTRARIASALEGLEHAPLETRDGIACIQVRPEDLHAALERLRDRAAFEQLTLVTGIDRLGQGAPEPRFEVVHQLLSIDQDDRVRIKTPLSSSAPRVPTCTDLWPGASFMERECWDMFGIVFEGHPDLRRLLMPEDYGHHPLRKDFPHQGIEPDRLYREWDRQRRAHTPFEQPAEAGPR